VVLKVIEVELRVVVGLHRANHTLPMRVLTWSEKQLLGTQWEDIDPRKEIDTLSLHPCFFVSTLMSPNGGVYAQNALAPDLPCFSFSIAIVNTEEIHS
jgi:hypothetical protein